jgi:hypothetical protein
MYHTSRGKQSSRTMSKTSLFTTPDRHGTIKRKVYHQTVGLLVTRTNYSPNSAWSTRISLFSKPWKSSRYKKNKEFYPLFSKLRLKARGQTNVHQNQYLECIKTKLIREYKLSEPSNWLHRNPTLQSLQKKNKHCKAGRTFEILQHLDYQLQLSH